MEKLQKHGRQRGADCSTDEAAVQERGSVYGVAEWPAARASCGHGAWSREPEVGGAPQMWGDVIGRGVKTSTNERPFIATTTLACHNKLQNIP
jgi:hypothetical protein